MAASQAELDRDLQFQLRRFGVDARPLTATTRPVYQKKLQQLISENKSSRPSASESTQDVGYRQETISPSLRRKSTLRNSRNKSVILEEDSMVRMNAIVPESVTTRSGRRNSRLRQERLDKTPRSHPDNDGSDCDDSNSEKVSKSILHSTSINESSNIESSFDVSYNNVSLQTSFSPVRYGTQNGPVSASKINQTPYPVQNYSDICDENIMDYARDDPPTMDHPKFSDRQTDLNEAVRKNLFNSSPSEHSNSYSYLDLNLRHAPPSLRKKLSENKVTISSTLKKVPSSVQDKPKASGWLSTFSSYFRTYIPKLGLPKRSEGYYDGEFSDSEDANGFGNNHISTLDPKVLAKKFPIRKVYPKQNVNPKVLSGWGWKSGKPETIDPTKFSSSNRKFSYRGRGHDNNNELLESKSDIPNGTSKYKYTPISESATSQYSLWSSHVISKALLVILAIFFCTIGIIYMNMSSQSSALRKKNTTTKDTFPICSNKASNAKECFDMKLLKETITLLGSTNKMLESELGEATSCKYLTMGGYQPNVTDRSIEEFIKSHPDLFKSSPNSLIDSVTVLIKANPHWSVNVANIKDHPGSSSGGKYYSIEHPGFGIMCQLSHWIALWSTYLLYVSLVFISLYIMYLGYSHYNGYRARQQEEIFDLVQQILELLIQQYKQHPNHPYLVINHVRDQLFSPKQRREKLSLWKAAVKFLSNEDSRVREEVINIKGEDCRVWHWISSSVPSARCQNGKVWQGRAFENSPLTSSLTPCLKIRNMFDPEVEFGVDWATAIQDAILEKCERVPILHIFVDKNSKEGCVYIMCQTERDAGLAFQALHGWYFDGNLITVKYLRVERYHEKFPPARNARVPLKPSNDQKLSMRGPKSHDPLMS